MLLPIIMISICLIALAAILFLNKRNKQRQEEQGNESVKSAQEFVNAIDVQDIFLYTRDQYIISYIKVQPISIELFSSNEKRMLAKKLTAELSSEDEAFKFIAVSRPVDITPLVSEYMDLISSTDDVIQKELLRSEIQEISNYALSGEVVERQFYYILWKKQNEYAENDLRKRTIEFSNKLNNAGLKNEILKQDEIIRLCNLIDNPAYISIEDTDISSGIPMLEQ